MRFPNHNEIQILRAARPGTPDVIWCDEECDKADALVELGWLRKVKLPEEHPYYFEWTTTDGGELALRIATTVSL